LDASDTPDAALGSTAGKTRIDSAVVWKLGSSNSLEPVQVRLGITDHAYTEVTAVLKGMLGAHDDVVTAAISSKTTAGPGTAQ